MISTASRLNGTTQCLTPFVVGQVSESVEVALAFAARGWPVVPTCWPDTEGNCGCGRIPRHRKKQVGKAPITRHGADDATVNPDRIREWWFRWPEANVGVDLWSAGLLAIDLDSLDAISEAQQLGLPETRIRRSRWPAHIYQRPDDCPRGRPSHWGNSASIDILSSGLLVLTWDRSARCPRYMM